MKNLFGIMFYFLIVTGCADKAEEIAIIEEVSEPASEETMQPMLLEYMCAILLRYIRGIDGCANGGVQ